MKRWRVLIAFYVVVCWVLGCAKPDRVVTVKSPTEGVFYTVETSYGHGAVASDFTRVYAHLERNGKYDRRLVLDGEYLEDSKIAWVGPHDVTICLKGGFTDTFRNEVTLITGDTVDSSETIYNHLQEHCQ